MRLTINFEEDLYRMAKGVALAEDISISKAVNLLLQRTLQPIKPSVPDRDGALQLKGRRRFPVVQGRRPFTSKDVARLDLEDDADQAS